MVSLPPSPFQSYKPSYPASEFIRFIEFCVVCITGRHVTSIQDRLRLHAYFFQNVYLYIL
jgi:hypothetical protein